MKSLITCLAIFFILLTTSFCILFMKAKKDVELIYGDRRKAQFECIVFSKDHFFSIIFRFNPQAPNYPYEKFFSWSIWPFSLMGAETFKKEQEQISPDMIKRQREYDRIWGSGLK